MAKNYSDLPYTDMRRKDRAADDAWIREFLHNSAFGALATAVDGQPFINSNLFVYDEKKQAIFLHTARTGRTRANIDANPRACFSVSEMGRLLPADVALEFSVEYGGVTVFGNISVVTDEQEATKALNQLLDKYFPHLQRGRDYRAVVPDELERTSVYRLDIEEWSGKRKTVAADFPGAFRYKEHG